MKKTLVYFILAFALPLSFSAQAQSYQNERNSSSCAKEGEYSGHGYECCPGTAEVRVSNDQYICSATNNLELPVDASLDSFYLRGLLGSDQVKTMDKQFIQEFMTSTVNCDQNNCMSKIFDCQVLAQGQRACRLGYNDEVRERGYSYEYGILVTTNSDGEVVSVSNF